MEKIGQYFHISLRSRLLWLTPPPPYGQPDRKISVFWTPSLRFPLKVREEYRRRGLARVRERDKALGFILGMVDFTRLSYSTSSSLYRNFCHVYRQEFPMPSYWWATPWFLIEWIFYWIESSPIEIFESIFELNFPGKKIIEYFFEMNIPEKNDIE